MRDAYHEELDALSDQLVEMTRLVGSAISRASTALLDADLSLAESVIAADDAINALRDDLDQPVARPAGPPAAGGERPAHDRDQPADERRPGADGRPGPARRPGRAAALPRVGGPGGAALDGRRDEPGRRAAGRQGGQRHRLAGRRRRAGAGERRRRDGPPAPRAVHGAARPDVAVRRGGGDRHHADRPLLRAVRRPRGLGRRPGGLPGHRASAPSTLVSGPGS